MIIIFADQNDNGPLRETDLVLFVVKLIQIVKHESKTFDFFTQPLFYAFGFKVFGAPDRLCHHRAIVYGYGRIEPGTGILRTLQLNDAACFEILTNFVLVGTQPIDQPLVRRQDAFDRVAVLENVKRIIAAAFFAQFTQQGAAVLSQRNDSHEGAAAAIRTAVLIQRHKAGQADQPILRHSVCNCSQFSPCDTTSPTERYITRLYQIDQHRACNIAKLCDPFKKADLERANATQRALVHCSDQSNEWLWRTWAAV